ncbi:MAG: hypothetical protein ACOX56_01155 [Acholeplasmataceae bacterium]|jgi:plasmid maintenance system killer protein
MKIEYDNKKVKTLFENFDLMGKEVGYELARRIKLRFEQLRAAETFYDYLQTRLGGPHRLSGDKNDLYAINVTRNVRLIVKPNSEDLSHEGLMKCKIVIIKGVEDYHGSKTTTYIP